SEPRSPFAPTRGAVPSPAPPVYSVPRRYDLATMMAVCMAYGCLLGLMRACGAPPFVTIWTAGLFTVVGAAQAVLFDGRSPRTASMFGGAVFGILSALVGLGLHDPIGLLQPMYILALAFGSGIQGAMLGYLAGTLVGGVFLVAHGVRRILGKGSL
ncbi:MAG: hypothetical protein JJ992_10680, partial [Planctomycetes bacterium]|nr:hypothetical protein [Planctomycetota bacterium]